MTVEGIAQVGGVTVTSIVESALWSSPDEWIKDQDHEAVIATTRQWCDVTVADDGWVVVPVRSYVISSGDQTIVVDTGQGAASPFESAIPGWRVESGDYLEDLEVAGVDRAGVDLVVMTHAHPDHTGWNMMPVDGVPELTFPNARYLLCELDWALVEAFGALADPLRALRQRGVLELVGADLVLTDEVRLVPTHGHTPGHVCVEIESDGERALILGDVVHHKISLANPAGLERMDTEEGVATRRALYERLAGTDIRVFASHFEAPAVGYFRARGVGYEFLESR